MVIGIDKQIIDAIKDFTLKEKEELLEELNDKNLLKEIKRQRKG
jgi:hypothetical protein